MADAVAHPLPAQLYGSLRGARLARGDAHATHVPHSTAYAAALTSAPVIVVDVAAGVDAPTLPVDQATSIPRPAPAPVRVLDVRLAATIVGSFLALGVVLVIVGAPFSPGGSAQLWTVLVTGLTTGGLSCLAVQGGLLASSLNPRDAAASSAPSEHVIGSFLIAKTVAYTLLGALLGLFGSVMQLSVATRGLMQLLIGVFMLLTALRMVWPHPWLNFVVLEPPPAARRFIRRISRQPDGLSTPIFLGALTVLIPCGVTQAMMAMAITTASPIAGAITMLLFTLGASPLFFVLSWAANSIGARMERQFNRIVAVLILILGYVAIQTGATLIGHPLPIRPLFTNLAPKGALVEAAQAGGVQSVDVVVHVDGYSPNNVQFTAGAPAKLVLVTHKITGCTRTINIPALDIQKPLAVTGRTSVTIPPQKAGTHLQWVCGMGMFTGTISFR